MEGGVGLDGVTRVTGGFGVWNVSKQFIDEFSSEVIGLTKNEHRLNHVEDAVLKSVTISIR